MKLREKLWLLASQAVNVVLGGDPDESLSARAWREQRLDWVARIDRVLGNGHCYAVFNQQRKRQHARV